MVLSVKVRFCSGGQLSPVALTGWRRKVSIEAKVCCDQMKLQVHAKLSGNVESVLNVAIATLQNLGGTG